jgi:hypothetical protein
MLISPEKMLCCLLLWPALVSSQRPPTPGRLSISSTPPGAPITIDGQATSRQTPSTFVVSPGAHNVSLKSLANCASPFRVSVPSGSTKTIDCDANKGWGPVQ